MSDLNDLCFTDEDNKGNRNSKTTAINNPLSQGCEPGAADAALGTPLQTPPLTTPAGHRLYGRPDSPNGSPIGTEIS